MKLIARLACAALISTAAAAAMAQGAASPAKKELVQKVLALQQAGIESIGAGLANQTANQVLQVVGQAMARVPADKREALGAELQAEVKKFFDDVAPILRASAVKNAPATIGTALEEKFSDDELKVLIAWFESPVSKKYQQLSPELQQSLGQGRKAVPVERGVHQRHHPGFPVYLRDTPVHLRLLNCCKRARHRNTMPVAE